MISKGENFKPPTYEEEWANRQFSIILNYLSQYQIPFNGQIYLQWLAIPYISIWKAGSSSKAGSTVWIMHNKLQTDCFIGSSQIPIPQVINEFGERWIKAGTELIDNPSLKIDNPDEFGSPATYAQKLIQYGEMFISVASDEDIDFSFR